MTSETGNASQLLILCYNRGCGQKFDPNDNGPESCRHHIGHPVFHDAYKGWSCCKKKCTDFTEFLNIKGCTVSPHSNVKPPEVEKPKEENKNLIDRVIEYAPPKNMIIPEQRPPFDTPLVPLKLEVSSSLREQLASLKTKDVADTVDEYNGIGNIPVGTPCHNNNCKTVYEGAETLDTRCTHHPGYPVFHEGLKFWSCCTKRTTDFNTFLEQVGCTTGEHVWFKKKNVGEVKCRLDWHQTGGYVFVSVFGKKCDPDASSVQVSPVRLKMSLYFPEQGGAYTSDIELRGVIDVGNSTVNVLPTKVEVKLKKKSLGSWSKLDVPRKHSDKSQTQDNAKNLQQQQQQDTSEQLSISTEPVDLSII